ncbi:small heat shock protein, chloroplastic-like [Diospyros lotus]|uniref:small heat shock protein, chloroplastic-like n=1 Tax=Diospyros lotus TaxID=55363 RepID=UPI002256CC81|nr:small heat shock protein, chloroplastic-like [Diospyros lotus]
MSHSLSKLVISLPVSSQTSSTNKSKLRLPESAKFLKPIGEDDSRGRCCKGNGVKAMAGDGKDSLDHLQRERERARKHQPQPPKRSLAQVAPIAMWDKFPTARTVQQMMETMERMMEDPFEYSGGWPSPLPVGGGGYSRGRTPWDIKEGEGEYKMRFDMPGMTKEDVKVWVEEKMLVVKAEKAQKKKKKKNGEEQEGNGSEENEEWSAKSYGRYSSRIALPDNVQFEKIKAEVKDGVLYITIPKASTSSSILDVKVE